MLLLISAIFIVLIIISLCDRYSYFQRQLIKIPGPKTWPLIGCAFEIMSLFPDEAFQYLRDSRNKYGRIHQVTAFHRAVVTVSNPQDVETLLSTIRYNEKQIPYTFLNSWLGDGLLISNGDKWQQRRKLLTPAFHFNILKGFQTTFKEQTEIFLTKIEELVHEKKIDVYPLISKTALNIMCETSMGTSLDEYSQAVANKYVKAIHDIGNIIEKRYIKVWYHIDWIYMLSSFARTEKKIVKYLHAFTKNIIQERKDYTRGNVVETSDCVVYGKRRLAMLDLLLENEKGGKIDINGIREEVDTFMFEGHDTTSVALSFMIMRVANEPDVQRKINDELSQIFGCSSRSPTFEDLNSMKYLECCIKESLRLYPSVHYMARHSSEDIVLSGYTVPPGVILHVSIYDIHHDPEYFPNPEEFIPERFLPENIAKRHPYSYIPFSAGPRNCIGQKFAMLEMKTVMSGLLRKFHLEPVTKPQDVVLVADLVLRSKNPLYVRFRPKEMTEQ